MQDTAFGPLELTPEKFWILDLNQFGKLVKGWQFRDRNNMQMLAWQTTHIINLFSKRKVTIDKLLGNKNTVNTNVTTKENTKKVLDELEDELVPKSVKVVVK